MVVKIGSKHQVTIPNKIALLFNLKKGDVLDVERAGNRIIMIPKEVVLEDKYPPEDLKAADKYLSKTRPKEELSFKSDRTALRYLKKKMAK